MEIDYQLEISSLNNWQSVQFKGLRAFEYEYENYLVFQIEIKSKFWEREQLLISDCEDLIDDRSITFNQVLISENNWNELLKLIQNWKDNFSLFHFDLSSINGVTIQFDLEVSKQVISSPDNPLLRLKIFDTKTKLEWGMVIDNTGIDF